MKTLRNELIDGKTLRLVEIAGGCTGVIFAGGRKVLEISGSDPEALWAELRAQLGKASASYFGYDEAMRVFRSYFPEGFQSADYANHERTYKLAAKAKLDAAAPLEEAASGTGFAEAALAAIRATNLIYPVEKARAQDMLRGTHGDAFVQAAARFTLGEHKALADMDRILRPYDNARWTVASYLPYLWRPDQHLFLKPAVSVDYAERVGHRFAQDYRSELDIAVYHNLLALADETRLKIGGLGPRDMIDIQSFIWVVGYYRPE